MTDPNTSLAPAPPGAGLKLSDESKHHALAGLFSIEPTNITELLSMAKMYAESELLPKEYWKKPQNIVIAIQMGRSLGLSSLQSILSICVINGRPTLWGDAIPALLYARADLDPDFGNGGIRERKPDEALAQGEGCCEIKMRGWAEPLVRTFSMAEAEKAGLIARSKSGQGNGPWVTYPGRMLQMRARSWAARDAAPHVLKGIRIREEEEDQILDAETRRPIQDIRPPKSIIDVESVDRFTQDVARSSGATSPSRPAGQASAPASSGQAWQGVINNITQQSGTKKDGKGTWVKYHIIGKDGSDFSTFDKKLMERARDFASSGEMVQIGYKSSQYGKDLESIQAVEHPPEETAGGPQDEPGSAG